MEGSPHAKNQLDCSAVLVEHRLVMDRRTYRHRPICLASRGKNTLVRQGQMGVGKGVNAVSTQQLTGEVI